jgi:hypothetical protein
MTQKSNKLPIITSPRGRTDWLKCWTPDYKFDSDGIFGGKIIMDNADATELMAMLDASHATAIDKAVEQTGKPRDKINVTDPYEVNPETGDVSIKLKLKANVTTQSGESFSQKPVCIDAKRQPITSEIPLWNGSLVRVGFQMIPYYTKLAGAGVSLRFKSVQVIDAMSGGGADVSMFAEEDGYTHDSVGVPETVTNFNNEETEPFEDIPF